MTKINEHEDNYSLRSRVFSRIRDGILNGTYHDNEELKEVAISEQLGVSRTPVREAFHQLELLGLVKIVPNKGAYVTGITIDDVRDIYMMRSLLEGLCARWATQNITDELVEAMEENIYLSEFHAKKGHVEQLAELDSEFHQMLYKASNSRMLQKQLKDFHEYVLRVRKKTLAQEVRSIECNEEHRQIMEAIKHKDADRAEILANNHVKNAFKNMEKSGLYEAYGVSNER